MTRRAVETTLVLAVSVIGIGLAFTNRDDEASIGAVTRGTPLEAVGQRAAAPTLPRRLEMIRRKVDLRSDQEPAWRRFVDAMTTLDDLTRGFARRVASGDPVDETSQRALHSLIYGQAMNEFEGALSSDQRTTFLRLAGDLATSAMCRKLVASRNDREVVRSTVR